MKKNLFRLFGPLRVIEKDIMKEQFSASESFVYGFLVPFLFVAGIALVAAVEVIINSQNI